MFTTLTFILLFGLWTILSGKFDIFHLSLGVLSSGLIAWLSHDLLFAEKEKGLVPRIAEGFRFLHYSVWLFYQIVVANIHVTILALSPTSIQRDLDPHVFSFKTQLKKDFSRFVLANSITLTPGTVTIRLHDDIFHVHAISRKAAGDLAASESVSEMERWVAWVFEGGSR